ncbi:sensor histidine kinase [Oryzihumus sp.]|uniref:sensor histidine kinase n=1 Tax=Oryzihumus sp. TaxID=1968903 RepID=UPI002EDB10BB
MTRTGRDRSLITRLLLAQVLVIAAGSLTLTVTAVLVAPGLFRTHLAQAGHVEPGVRQHAEEAFASSFVLSLSVATLAALLAAGAISWLLVRRIATPVQQLADAADAVASGRYDVRVPAVTFGRELEQLSGAFAHMAHRLADTDAARTRMLADLAHELRTPLATLAAYIDGLEDGVIDPDHDAWVTMRNQVERLRRLATDVRQVAAAQEGLDLRFVAVDPVALAHSAVAAAMPAYTARGVELTYQGPDSAPLTTGDPGRLGQVLANLLDNALRHTSPGGHVRLALEPREDELGLTVADDGEGLAPDELEAIFERFHRVDPARGDRDGSGSGLGLTIARAIAHGHGGTLTATSAGPGRGAAFTLALPWDARAGSEPD